LCRPRSRCCSKSDSSLFDSGRHRPLHSLGNDTTGHGSQLMETGIPELYESLMSEPTLVDEQAVDLDHASAGSNARLRVHPSYHAALVFLATSLFGGLDDLGRNDATVRRRYARLVHFAWDAFLQQMSQAEAHFGDLGRWHRCLQVLIAKLRKHCHESASSACWRSCAAAQPRETDRLALLGEASRDGGRCHRPRVVSRNPGRGQWPSSEICWASRRRLRCGSWPTATGGH